MTTVLTAVLEWTVRVMNDYIKREDAIRAIMEYIRDGCDESDEFIDGTYKAKLIIEEDIPSADVVEVRHAKDIGYESSYGWKDVCSLCGCELGTSKSANYCPNCGARIDGEEQEND